MPSPLMHRHPTFNIAQNSYMDSLPISSYFLIFRLTPPSWKKWDIDWLQTACMEACMESPWSFPCPLLHRLSLACNRHHHKYIQQLKLQWSPQNSILEGKQIPTLHTWSNNSLLRPEGASVWQRKAFGRWGQVGDWCCPEALHSWRTLQRCTIRLQEVPISKRGLDVSTQWKKCLSIFNEIASLNYIPRNFSLKWIEWRE